MTLLFVSTRWCALNCCWVFCNPASSISMEAIAVSIIFSRNRLSSADSGFRNSLFNSLIIGFSLYAFSTKPPSENCAGSSVAPSFIAYSASRPMDLTASLRRTNSPGVSIAGTVSLFGPLPEITPPLFLFVGILPTSFLNTGFHIVCSISDGAFLPITLNDLSCSR